MKTTHQKILDVTFTALFAALCYIALTVFFIPFANMYIHFGNMIVVLAALLVGGWQGGLSASWDSVRTLLHDSGIDGRLPVVLTCASLIVFAAESNGRSVARWIRNQSFVLRWTLYYAAAAVLLFFGAFGQSAFIYQQF